MSFINQLKHAWNAFNNPSPAGNRGSSLSGYNPTRRQFHYGVEDRSIVTAVCTRIAVDVSMIDFMHVDVDENDRFKKERVSGLNYCLTSEANIDQSAMGFKLDIVSTILDGGVAAVIPVDTNYNPNVTGGYDILTMRVGRVVDWQPRHVKVSLYNDRTGNVEVITVPKDYAAIIQNPLYDIMNRPNSTMQRLMAKLKLLDSSDEQMASNSLDIIIQLPYTIKSEQRKQQAVQRIKDIEFQLSQSGLGIAYADATEKVNQLNRPVENQMQDKIEYLTDQLYSQLGITKEVLAGNASEEEINNYYRRTVEPIAKAISEEFERKFLTKTARTQNQKVIYLRSMFDFVTTTSIGDLGDKLIRNEILSPDEFRAVLGYKPSNTPGSDELRNRNMPVDATGNEPNAIEPKPDTSVKMERITRHET